MKRVREILRSHEETPGHSQVSSPPRGAGRSLGWGAPIPGSLIPRKNLSRSVRKMPAITRTSALLLAACAMLAPAFAQSSVDTGRQAQLIRMVRQDCGSCHGIQLTGGLGPALTQQLMAEIPLENLVAIIYHGRPGTPMPGWKTMISEADATWIAQQLRTGFPLEKGTP